MSLPLTEATQFSGIHTNPSYDNLGYSSQLCVLCSSAAPKPKTMSSSFSVVADDGVATGEGIAGETGGDSGNYFGDAGVPTSHGKNSVPPRKYWAQCP
ncbi:hypothetical protein Tco_1060316 [Tanacetum coccineum]